MAVAEFTAAKDIQSFCLKRGPKSILQAARDAANANLVKSNLTCSRQLEMFQRLK